MKTIEKNLKKKYTLSYGKSAWFRVNGHYISIIAYINGGTEKASISETRNQMSQFLATVIKNETK